MPFITTVSVFECVGNSRRCPRAKTIQMPMLANARGTVHLLDASPPAPSMAQPDRPTYPTDVKGPAHSQAVASAATVLLGRNAMVALYLQT